MSEGQSQPQPKNLDDQMQEIIDHPGFHKDTIPNDDHFYEAYAAQKAKGLIDGMNYGLQETARQNETSKAYATELQISNDKLQHEIDHDQKTGLLSETKWMQELETTIETLKPDQKLDVYLGDLNGFKPVNDALGHDQGDELLVIAGTAFSEAFSREVLAHGSREPKDPKKVARLGGDEFTGFSIHSPDSDPNHTPREEDISVNVSVQSKRVNDNLRVGTVGTKFETFNVSFAIGGVQYDPSIDKSAMDLFVRADAAMFAAKYQDKLDRITPEDKDRLRVIIPYIESKGARVDGWLKEAAYSETILEPEV